MPRYVFTLFVCLLAASEIASAQALPAGWAISAIGPPALPPQVQTTSDGFVVSGAGDIGGRADQFAFLYRSLSGDGAIVARVTSFPRVHNLARAGLMIRESLAADARNAFVHVAPARGVAFQRRLSPGATSTSTAGGGSSPPVWLRLEREGARFTAAWSDDGRRWTEFATDTIAMSGSVHIGFAVSSREASSLATATFAAVDLLTPLPQEWQSRDIGAVSVTGSAWQARTGIVIDGAGTGIGGTADQFRFAYRQVIGDADIVARLTSLEETDPAAKAGLMVRGELIDGAVNLFVGRTGSGSLILQSRSSRGATTSTGSAPGAGLAWMKIERRGTTVSASGSADGVTWTLVGTQTLPLPAAILVGLAVTSHQPSVTATAAFDSVAVSAAAGNQAPTVSLTSPAAGASYQAPATIALAAAAQDPDGTVARVDFFNGAALIGSDGAAPFTFSWTNVAAGTYTITAVAYDNAGRSASSAGRTISVVAPPPPPPSFRRLAVFNPSADHVAGVQNYVLEIFAAGTNPAVTPPVGSQNLGKPPVINGECTADISATVYGLPGGNYFATVTAIGPGGSARSAPTSVFSR